MLKPSLYDYSNGYILASGTIRVASLGASVGNNDLKIVFKNCTPFTDCISKINNTQRDKVKDINVVMAMYNFIEYSDNYSKTSGCLLQYHRDQPTLNNDFAASFRGNNASFRFKQK